MTKIIGLTGGIGSGKSTVAKLFEELGVPIYIADDEAKKIMELPETIKKITRQFGENIITDNRVDRQKLAQLVFQDIEKLKQLNGIIHPLVKEDFKYWIKRKQGFPFVIKESAILFESGNNKYCDKIITVTAPLQTRIERVMARDNTEKKFILNRINNQCSDDMRISYSDFIIENTDFESTKKEVIEIFNKLKMLE